MSLIHFTLTLYCQHLTSSSCYNATISLHLRTHATALVTAFTNPRPLPSDENHDGVLEECDLKLAAERLCRRYSWAPDDPRALRVKALMKDLWLSLRRHVDENQDDKVTRMEWVSSYGRLCSVCGLL